MKRTTIAIKGYFTKKDIAKILKMLWKIQMKVNPKNIEEKFFLIWVSNDEFPDPEVRALISKHFRKMGVKVTDLTKEKKFSGS